MSDRPAAQPAVDLAAMAQRLVNYQAKEFQPGLARDMDVLLRRVRALEAQATAQQAENARLYHDLKFAVGENERAAADLAAQQARLGRLEKALAEYAEPRNWWQVNHVEQNKADPDYGIPRKVWSWDDCRKPWTMAEAALAPDARGGAEKG